MLCPDNIPIEIDVLNDQMDNIRKAATVETLPKVKQSGRSREAIVVESNMKPVMVRFKYT